MEPLGRFADASNATLLVLLVDEDAPSLEGLASDLGREPTIEDLDPDHLAVYKPRRGEAPLWDFPAGTLHRREVAAYEVSEALGWGLVPLTVLREDGPFGPGSVQRFVPHDPSLHYFRLLEVGSEAVLAALRRMVVFDLVIDNADRKGGHVLLEGIDDPPGRPEDPTDGAVAGGSGGAVVGGSGGAVAGDDEVVDGPVRLVDHGVAFNVERKLRTVAWEFADEPVPDEAHEALARLAVYLDGDLGERLTELLAPDEVAVLRHRVARLTDLDRFPPPTGPRAYPWPPL
jgi:hypothetical protein